MKTPAPCCLCFGTPAEQLDGTCSACHNRVAQAAWYSLVRGQFDHFVNAVEKSLSIASYIHGWDTKWEGWSPRSGAYEEARDLVRCFIAIDSEMSLREAEAWIMLTGRFEEGGAAWLRGVYNRGQLGAQDAKWHRSASNLLSALASLDQAHPESRSLSWAYAEPAIFLAKAVCAVDEGMDEASKSALREFGGALQELLATLGLRLPSYLVEVPNVTRRELTVLCPECGDELRPSNSDRDDGQPSWWYCANRSEGHYRFFFDPRLVKLPVRGGSAVPLHTEDKAMVQASPGNDSMSVGPISEGGGRRVDADRSLKELLDELDELVGLASVKQEVRELANLLRVQQMRMEAGLPTTNFSHHLAFTGNPGTGKTTVARLIGQLYRLLGIVSYGHVIEASRSDLVAGYIGQTTLKTTEIFNRALGGVLFIDEAYSLNRGGNDFGQEAIDTLVKLMEDHRDDVVVIVAGYPDLMSQFLRSNPGLASRFKRTIAFPDYTNEQLVEIFDHFCAAAGYSYDLGLEQRLRSWFNSAERDESFGNARLARQLFEVALTGQANRLSTEEAVSSDDLTCLTEDDLPLPAEDRATRPDAQSSSYL